MLAQQSRHPLGVIEHSGENATEHVRGWLRSVRRRAGDNDYRQRKERRNDCVAFRRRGRTPCVDQAAPQVARDGRRWRRGEKIRQAHCVVCMQVSRERGDERAVDFFGARCARRRKASPRPSESATPARGRRVRNKFSDRRFRWTRYRLSHGSRTGENVTTSSPRIE